MSDFGPLTVNFKTITDVRGDLTYLEGEKDIPFSIKRVYYIYNVPENSARGGHAHINLRQVMFAIVGSFTISLDAGEGPTEFILNNPEQGLLIESGVWRELGTFTPGTIAMVVASDYYSESDYVRSYTEFLKKYGSR